jgi:hypothetical protein
MKKVLLLLLCLFATSMMWAGDTTVVVKKVTWPTAASTVTNTIGKFTFTANKNSGSTNPQYVSSAGDFRVYANGSLSVETSGNPLTGLVFYTSAQGKKRQAAITADLGTATVDTVKDQVTWAGSTTKVTLTVGAKAVYGTDAATNAGQLDFDSVKITYSDVAAAVKAPTITPEGGKFIDSVLVTLACETTGATIYYTTDGTTPTSKSTVYKAPFALKATATVKAIAVKGTATSSATSATFTAYTGVKSIAEFNALANSAKVSFLNPVSVLYQNGSNLYVKDSTGYMLVYGSTGKTYKNGDRIPAGFTGVRATYSGYPEMTGASDFAAADTNVVINPDEMLASKIDSTTWGHYVVVKSVKLGNSKFVASDGNVAYYNTFKITLPTDTDYFYNAVGIVSAHSGNMQVLPISVNIDSLSLAELLAQGVDGKKYVLNDKAILITINLSRTNTAGVKEYLVDVVDTTNANFLKLDVDSAFAANVHNFINITGASVNGTFSGSNLNPTVTLKGVMPTISNVPPVGKSKRYNLAELFNPKADEAHMLIGYYINGQMRGYSSSAPSQGQSIDLDFSYNPMAQSSLTEGAKYEIACIAQLKQPWEQGNKIKSTDEYAYKNYFDIVVLPPMVVTGVDNVDAAGVKVVATKGEITVTGAQNVKIYTMAGALVSTADKAEVAAGAYVVVADGKTVKVLVR